MRPPAREAVPALVQTMKEGLKDPDAHVDRRPFVAEVLGWMGPEARAAVPALIEGLGRDKDTIFREACIRALEGIGPAAKDAVPALRQALQDDNPGVRSLARSALKKIDPAAAAKAGVP